MSDKNGFEMSTGVFENTRIDTISANSFYAILGLCICWGLGLTAYLANHFATMNIKMNTATIFLALIVSFAGVYASARSDNMIVSFIGYNMIILPFGIILAPVVNKFSPDIIRDASALTLGIAVIMMIAGILLPKVFEHLGGALLIALIGLLIIRVVQIFVPAFNFGIIDYIAAAIFSLYIGYDMYRASNIGYTADNAVDVAVQLYLDILNLFLNILSILGRKK